MNSTAYRGVQFMVSYPDSLEGLALLARGAERAFADWLIAQMVEGASYDPWSGKPGEPMDRAGGYWTGDEATAWSYAGVAGQASGVGPDAGNITIPVVMTAEYPLNEHYRNHTWDSADMNNPYDEAAQWKEDSLGIPFTPSGMYHLPEGTPLTITSFEVSTPTQESAKALLDAFGKDVEGDWGSLGPADWFTSEYRTWRLPIPTMQTTAFNKTGGLIYLDLPEGVGAWIVDHGDYVSIDKINVLDELRRQGLGTKAMQMICDWADQNGKILSLTPANDWGTPLTVLRRWYKTFGFVNNNKGEERFTVGDDMIRFPRGSRTTAGRSGDGWIECSDGEERWGIYGSAGVLFFYDDGPDRRYFLQHRAPGVDSGGTWGIPGGALDEGETPEMGALREFREEVGFVPAHRIVQVYEDAVADDWSYTTIVAQVGEPFGHEGSTWEADTGGWFTLSEMVGLNLHPGFASSLGRIT